MPGDDEAQAPPRESVFPPRVLEGFSFLSSQIAELADEVRRSREATDGGIREIRREVRGLREDVGQLQTAVFGDVGPPPASPSSVVSRVSTTEEEHDELRGMFLALSSEVAGLKKINVDQSRALGVGQKGVAFLGSREGRKFVIHVLTLLAALAGAVAGARGVPTATPVHEVAP